MLSKVAPVKMKYMDCPILSSEKVCEETNEKTIRKEGNRKKEKVKETVTVVPGEIRGSARDNSASLLKRHRLTIW
jgi:hypothetical protein